jgi:hypothetical protein
MPQLGFSGANLATVAYAEVDGTAGASTVTNSGVTTTRTAAGTYVVVLPTGITQNVSRDLIFVTPKTANGDTQPNPAGLVAKMAVVDDTLEATKTIAIFSGDPSLAASTRIDSSFSILILRTTITPPTGAPA